MKRTKVLKELRKIAKTKGVEFELDARTDHDFVSFNGEWVTTVARHADIPERTALSSIDTAKKWEKKT